MRPDEFGLLMGHAVPPGASVPTILLEARRTHQ
jgi:hypothetical protein